MTQNNIQPDLVSFYVFLKSCIRNRDLSSGKLIHRCLVESKVEPDSVVLNSLIVLYSKCGEWELARKVFKDMGERRDLVSWSAMISCYVRNGMQVEANEMFVEMVELDFRSNEYCFSGVIHACYGAEYEGVGLVPLGFALKICLFDVDLSIGCALIDMLAKIQDMVSTRKVFDTMTERSIVVWTLMITRYAQCGFARDVVDLFMDMLIDGLEPEQFTMSAVISIASEHDSSHISQQLHSQAVRLGLVSDLCLCCSLVVMYAKLSSRESMDDAQKIFDWMTEHNVISWTAIIIGYVQYGNQDNEALSLFNEMVKGKVRPNLLYHSQGMCQSFQLYHSQADEAKNCIAFPFKVRELDVDDSLLDNFSLKDLQPPHPRPKTSARTAKRLITQIMGLKLSSDFGSNELRKQEEARKNRIHTRQSMRDDAWGPDDQ